MPSGGDVVCDAKGRCITERDVRGVQITQGVSEDPRTY